MNRNQQVLESIMAQNHVGSECLSRRFLVLWSDICFPPLFAERIGFMQIHLYSDPSSVTETGYIYLKYISPNADLLTLFR